MKNLISMTDFVISQWSMDLTKKQRERIANYANFLKQKLEIWQVVPCKLVDGVWVVLEEPKYYGKKYTDDITEKELILHEEFVQAKERCLFERFEYINKSVWFWDGFNRILIFTENLGFDFYQTVEDLVKYNLELTPTAQKQIGV